jgi:flavin reductase (DIM6/NTAB) family NADH-FMN oxidoreductase RutF
MSAQEQDADNTAPFVSYDMTGLTLADGYKLFMGSVIPRPVAFVSSLNADGKVNLAPFSNFMVISSVDGFVAFSVGNEGAGKDSRYKDTQVNVRRAGEFVINLASSTMAQTVQQCSETYPPDVSEVDETGLTLVASSKVKTPRIAECKVQFECRLHDMQTFGRTSLVVGKVVQVHVRSDIISDYKIDPRKYSPLGRIGGRRYVELGKFIDV